MMSGVDFCSNFFNLFSQVFFFAQGKLNYVFWKFFISIFFFFLFFLFFFLRTMKILKLNKKIVFIKNVFKLEQFSSPSFFFSKSIDSSQSFRWEMDRIQKSSEFSRPTQRWRLPQSL